MSKPKVFCLPYYAVELGEFTRSEFYLKSEADKVIAHANYKRCKAMAKYCELREDEFGSDSAKRWLKIWLKLAEEPTWAKFLQLIHKTTAR